MQAPVATGALKFPAFPPEVVAAARAAAAVFWQPYTAGSEMGNMLAPQTLSERRRKHLVAQLLLFWAIAAADWQHVCFAIDRQLAAAPAPVEPWVTEAHRAEAILSLLSLFHIWVFDEEYLMIETFLAEPGLIIGRTVAKEQLLSQWISCSLVAAMTDLLKRVGEPDAPLAAEARAFQDLAERLVWIGGSTGGVRKHLTERELEARLGVQTL